MAERSPRSPAVCEKYQSDCMWNLLSIFHFRQGHFNRKLLSNGKRVDRNPVGTGYSRRKHDERGQGNDDKVDNKTPTVAAGKASVKKLQEEDMPVRQHLKKQITPAGVGLYSEPVRYAPKKHASQIAFRTPDHGQKDAVTTRHQQPYHPLSVEKSSHVLDSAAITDRLNEINMQLVEMSEAAEALIDQKFIDGKIISKDEASHQSKQFLDALMTLNSNKELFRKLIQDPNSLLVKHIQDLPHSQADKERMKSSSEAKVSECGNSAARHCEEPVCNQKFQKQNMHYFFWKKIKSHNNYPSKGSDNPQTPDRIVVLKPDLTSTQNSLSKCSHFSSLQSDCSLTNKGRTARPAFFSLGDTKRKLKHAMEESKEEQQWLPMKGSLHKFQNNHQGSEDGRKGFGSVIVGSNSPCRTYIDDGGAPKSPFDIKRKDRIGKPETSESSSRHGAASTSECGCKNLHFSTIKHSKQREFGIYVEAKKHISEMLSSGSEDEYFIRKQVPRTLGRILSLPEHDYLPTLSPARDREHSFTNAQMTFSPYNFFQVAKGNNVALQYEQKTSCPSLLRNNVEAPPCPDDKKPINQWRGYDFKPNISEYHFPLTKEHESTCPISNNSRPKGDINLSDVSFDPNNTTVSNTKRSIDTAKICEEIGSLAQPMLDLISENQSSTSSLDLSPPSTSGIEKLEELDSSIKDKMEHPSPVSVLEPFFAEDISSPASTPSKPGELPMQPLQINFEEHCPALVVSPSNHKISLTACLEDRQFIYEHVRAVLQASGLNCDEVLVKQHSSGQLLEESLFDEAELFPVQSFNDHKLLCDCVSEVFLEAYQHYFGCSPWISFIKPMVWSVLVQKSVIHEVIKGVHWHLFPQTPPHTLEQLVAKDMAKSGTWMDIRSNTEDIVIEMVEAILEELIESLCELQA